MSPEPENPLQKVVAQSSGSVLVLHDAACSGLVAGLRGDDLVTHCLDAELPEPRRWAVAALVVPDAAALRRAVSLLPRLGRARTLVCWLTEAEQAALLVPRPEWPPIVQLQGRRLPAEGALTVIRLARPVPANAVFEELARAVVPGGPAGGGGVLVATDRPSPDHAPPADPGVRLVGAAADCGDPDLVVPPDLVLTRAVGPVTRHEVIDRSPTLVSDERLLEGPIDEGVLNPAGFAKRPEQGLVDLLARDGRLELRGPGLLIEVDPRRGATARIVAALRDHLGVRVVWDDQAPDARAPHHQARVVAGLAMAGVPLLSGPLPPAAAARLGPALTGALTGAPTGPADLDDPLHREEHSVRQRRAALRESSTLAWRARLAEAAGIGHRLFPSCSIVLATKRPHQLEFALRQVARQRGADVELVVAAHGFTPDAGQVRAHLGDRAVVVPMPADALFGDVLAAGVEASSGELVVKMDDDDWYGPDFIGDLLLARHYSGADVVGMPAEYVYLEGLDRTIRRNDDSERTARFVAGGTMMIDRALLASVGGFRPVRRFVDAQLLAATQAAGASVYRTQGLGYVLRRTADGHTWDAGLDYFLDPERLEAQWDGFVPSALLEHDADRQGPSA